MPVNYKLYPENWRDVIRPDILRRDNYKCKICGAGQRKIGYRDSLGQFVECDPLMQQWATQHNHKLITIYLSIAHIDHDITNNDYSNLMALCQQHHNRHDAKQRGFKRSATYRNRMS